MPYISVYLQENYHIVNDILFGHMIVLVYSQKRNMVRCFEPIIMATKGRKARYTFNSQRYLSRS